jgi:sugar/nucleoside kinase (ribokinase family)
VQKRVLTVGEVNVDIIFTGLTNIPLSEQDTLAQRLDIVVGGQTGTIARALSRLGLDVTFVGRVGDDDYGRKAIQELSAAGVSVSGLVVDPSLKTGVTVVLSTGTERAFATYLGSISEVKRSDVKPELLARADHLHVGSYYLQRALRPDMLDLFQEAKSRGLTTSIDPGWDSFKEWGKDILAVLRYVDIFLPNEVEAMAIAETGSPEKALDILADYANTVVIKMGRQGCLARSRAASLYCPAFSVPVVDVTSAGDIFNAGFLYGFLNKWSLAETVKFANACGALSVSGAGSAGIMSGVAEVEAFLAARGDEVTPHSGGVAGA